MRPQAGQQARASQRDAQVYAGGISAPVC